MPAPPTDMLPGDWSCPSCNASNFARRTECFKCHASKGDDGGGGGGQGPKAAGPDGEDTREWRGGDAEGDDAPPPPPVEPDFGLSGKLAAETNTFKGVELLHNEPPEVRVPCVREGLSSGCRGGVGMGVQASPRPPAARLSKWEMEIKWVLLHLSREAGHTAHGTQCGLVSDVRMPLAAGSSPPRSAAVDANITHHTSHQSNGTRHRNQITAAASTSAARPQLLPRSTHSTSTPAPTPRAV